LSLRVGLVGPGWVAQDRHLPSLRRAPGADVVALCDRNLDNARRVASDFGVRDTFGSFGEMLDVGLDAVFITTPPFTHAELAIEALEAGCAVFTEKPMALSEADATSMVRAANASGLVLCVSHNFLFSNSVRSADRLIGDVPPHYVFATQLSSDERRLPSWYRGLPGGLFLDESPHLLYTTQHFLGGELVLEDVRYELDTDRQPVFVELRARGGSGRAQLTMLFDSPVSEWHVASLTKDRVIDVDLFRDITTSVRSDGAHKPVDILRSSASAIGGHVSGFARAGARYVAKRQTWGHEALIRLFLDAVRTGGPSPVPLDESLAIVRLTDAIICDMG